MFEKAIKEFKKTMDDKLIKGNFILFNKEIGEFNDTGEDYLIDKNDDHACIVCSLNDMNGYADIDVFMITCRKGTWIGLGIAFWGQLNPELDNVVCILDGASEYSVFTRKEAQRVMPCMMKQISGLKAMNEELNRLIDFYYQMRETFFIARQNADEDLLPTPFKRYMKKQSNLFRMYEKLEEAGDFFGLDFTYDSKSQEMYFYFYTDDYAVCVAEKKEMGAFYTFMFNEIPERKLMFFANSFKSRSVQWKRNGLGQVGIVVTVPISYSDGRFLDFYRKFKNEHENKSMEAAMGSYIKETGYKIKQHLEEKLPKNT